MLAINETKRCENPSESYKVRIPLIHIPKSSLICKAKIRHFTRGKTYRERQKNENNRLMQSYSSE